MGEVVNFAKNFFYVPKKVSNKLWYIVFLFEVKLWGGRLLVCSLNKFRAFNASRFSPYKQIHICWNDKWKEDVNKTLIWAFVMFDVCHLIQ